MSSILDENNQDFVRVIKLPLKSEMNLVLIDTTPVMSQSLP